MCYFGKNILGKNASLLVGQFFSFQAREAALRVSLSFLPGAALEIQCNFSLRRISEVCKKSLDLTGHRELPSVLLHERKGEECYCDY